MGLILALLLRAQPRQILYAPVRKTETTFIYIFRFFGYFYFAMIGCKIVYLCRFYFEKSVKHEWIVQNLEYLYLPCKIVLTEYNIL